MPPSDVGLVPVTLASEEIDLLDGGEVVQPALLSRAIADLGTPGTSVELGAAVTTSGSWRVEFEKRGTGPARAVMAKVSIRVKSRRPSILSAAGSGSER